MFAWRCYTRSLMEGARASRLVTHERLPIIVPSIDLIAPPTKAQELPMKNTKNQKLLKLNKETLRRLDENDLKNVNGGGSCLPQLPPPPPLES